MVHLLIIKLNSKEIDGLPVTGTPVISRTEVKMFVHLYRLRMFIHSESRFFLSECRKKTIVFGAASGTNGPLYSRTISFTHMTTDLFCDYTNDILNILSLYFCHKSVQGTVRPQ